MYLNDAFPISMCSKWRRNLNQELDSINHWEYLAYTIPRGVFCNEGYLDCWLLCCFMTHAAGALQRGAGAGGVTGERRGRSGPVTGVSPPVQPGVQCQCHETSAGCTGSLGTGDRYLCLFPSWLFTTYPSLSPNSFPVLAFYNWIGQINKLNLDEYRATAWASFLMSLVPSFPT